MSLNKLDGHFISGAILLMLALFPAFAQAGESQGWLYAGGDLHNTRSAGREWRINPATASRLHTKWVFTAEGEVSATPAVDNGAVYVPDWGGWIHKVDATTGARLWSRKISDFTGVAKSLSRTTPAIQGHRLFFGTQDGQLVALDKASGNLLWKMRVDPHPAAVVTQSPIVVGDRVLVGVASIEEFFAGDPSYPCCSFRGSVISVRVSDGALMWRAYTVPEGYSGGAVWGSTLTVDERRHSLYVTTGNNYSVPAAVSQCLSSATTDEAATACVSPDDIIDGMMALDIETGARKWARRLYVTDVWTVACFFDPDSCLSNSASPDFDFGQGAILFSVRGEDGHRRELVGAGQKSGMYWALDPETGDVVWHTQVGPGSPAGGLMWGSAAADGRIYTALSNNSRKPYTLPSGETSFWGNFTALDAATGHVLWQTPDPSIAADMAPVTEANGVVFGCSMDVEGHMFALDARTGTILWDFASGGSCNGGAAVVDGSVYWGSGYSHYGMGTTNNKLYAFSVR